MWIIDRLSDEQMFWQYNEESNSIAVIVKHIGGNMLSRWTNFWKEDGEKPWRNRDMEFVNTFKNKTEILDYWEKGWACLFEALNEITPENINYTTVSYTHLDVHKRQVEAFSTINLTLNLTQKQFCIDFLFNFRIIKY